LDSKKWKQAKTSRDSLYLSLERNDSPVYIGGQNISSLPKEILKEDSISTDSIALEELDSIGFSYILPSKVLGFWNEKFNNTNLATHEFERRMQAIHYTCDNSVLDVYLKNLDQPIHKSDAQVAAMGYGNFQQFAAEKVGKVDAKNPHTKQLQKFYEKAVSQLQNRNKTLQKEE